MTKILIILLILVVSIVIELKTVFERIGSTECLLQISIFLIENENDYGLDYTFPILQNQNIDKENIHLWIGYITLKENDNVDRLKKWLNASEFRGIYMTERRVNYDELGNWGKGNVTFEEYGDRINFNLVYKLILEMRKTAMKMALNKNCKCIMFMEGDVLLVNKKTIEMSLQYENMTWFAPMLDFAFSGNTVDSDYKYSNCIEDDKSIIIPPDFDQILTRQSNGIFSCPILHSLYFINLQRNEPYSNFFNLHNNDQGWTEDRFVFLYQMYTLGIKPYIFNFEFYGYIIPVKSSIFNQIDKKSLFKQALLEINNYHDSLVHDKTLQIPHIVDSIGFDKIYFINLERRKERHDKMMKNFEILSLKVKWFKAHDANDINNETLHRLNINVMNGYRCPLSGRKMNMGEVACFISHFDIWTKTIINKYKMVLILEDDIRFHAYFTNILKDALSELATLTIPWDMIYIGRKNLMEFEEYKVSNSQFFVYPNYSHWTIGYILSNRGARKLINSQPLSNIIPIDEFLPIMYKSSSLYYAYQHFYNDNFIALSIEPTLIEPTHYTHDEDYYSDTEYTNTLIYMDYKDEL
ncbi:hypothetical protein A3Q56_01792 [Intoshia linei]|uniref:Glycosyl transferase family 25 domain-containing protein n=1 Tax=Intoshia linei TaxID=1819745 RepID=A0A177B7X2_9BILA|nr:hypothetical protein A3Q56_01792 [Intoshia linei]